MANENTTTLTGRSVVITFGESGSSGTDWACATTGGNGLSCPGGIYVRSLTFIPSAANDVIRIQDSKDGLSSGGAYVWAYKADAVVGIHRIDFNPPRHMYPVIDVSSCTFGGSTNTAQLLIELA